MTAALAIGAAALPASAAAAPPPDFAVQADVARRQLTNLVTQLYAKTSPSDTQWYSAGTWVNKDMNCPACHLGPATAAATSRIFDRDAPSWVLDAAIASFDRAIEDQDETGLWLPEGNLVLDSGARIIHTMFFANELGTTLMKLRNVLPAATVARWTLSLKRTADLILRGNETTWYSNGNINLAYSEELYLTWLATGDARYRTAFDAALDFVISPPQPRWPGRGLVVTKQGKKADGSDSAGYFTEQGTGGVGYDPYYSVLQTDVLSRLYLLTRDARVLRALNMVTNQQLQRVSAAGLFDTSGGTRITNAGAMPYTTSGPAVLVMTGNRPDLAPTLWGFQFAQLVAEVGRVGTTADHIQYRSVGTEYATIVQAMQEGRDGSAARPIAAP